MKYLQIKEQDISNKLSNGTGKVCIPIFSENSKTINGINGRIVESE